MKKVFLRTAFNYDTNEASDESGLKCEDPSLAKQSFAEEVDINTIVRRFGLTGQLPSDMYDRVPVSADFDGVYDFHTAMNAVRAAQEAFDSMPASMRARFDNSPQKLMEFVENPENLEEARKLGLARPAEPVKAADTPADKGAAAPS